MAGAAPAGVFDEVQAGTLAQSDTEHWWFEAKAEIVASVLTALAPPGTLVDVGAGAGGVSALLRDSAKAVIAVEGSAELARHCHTRHELLTAVGNVADVPLAPASVATVTLLDVMEHQLNPLPMLREARRVLQPGGLLVVTVPAHAWLWSRADEALGHVKRYTKARLRQELEAAGFEVELCTHVFSWLVAPVWLKRRAAADDQEALGLGVDGQLVRRVARLLTSAERRWIRRRSLPLGTSVVCAARKSGPHATRPVRASSSPKMTARR